MKHYYAIAVDLEQREDKRGLSDLAAEWTAQQFRYQVFGALARAIANRKAMS